MGGLLHARQVLYHRTIFQPHLSLPLQHTRIPKYRADFNQLFTLSLVAFLILVCIHECARVCAHVVIRGQLAGV